MTDQVVIKIGANATGAVAAFGAVAGAAGAMASRVIGFASNAARALVRMVPATLEAADNMHKSAQRAGLNVETFSKLAYAGDLAGVSIEDLVVASREAAKQGMTLDGAIIKTADDFERLTSETEKINLARQRFGKGSQALIPLLNQGSAAIREQVDETGRLGIVIGGKFARDAERFNDTLTRIKASFRGIVIQLSEQVLPAIQRLADLLLKLSQNRMLRADLAELARGPVWLREQSAFGQITQAGALQESPYGPITPRQQAAFDAVLAERRKIAAEAASQGFEASVQANRVEIKVPEQKMSGNWTSRGFIAFGEMQMLNRTFSFQKSVLSTLAEIVGLQKTYLPRMAETLS